MARRRNKVLPWSSPSRRCSSPAPTASSWRSGFLCEVRVQESSAGASSSSSSAWRSVFRPFYPRLQRQLGCAGWWEGGSSSRSLRWSWLPSASTDPCRLELGALPRPTVRSALAHPELRLRVSSPAQVKACVRWSSLRFGFEGPGGGGVSLRRRWNWPHEASGPGTCLDFQFFLGACSHFVWDSCSLYPCTVYLYVYSYVLLNL